MFVKQYDCMFVSVLFVPWSESKCESVTQTEIKTVVTQDVSTETLSDSKCESVTQTSGPLLHGEFSLFRSNGNLAVLSNFHAFKFKHYGTTYNSAEHAYQHQMAIFHSKLVTIMTEANEPNWSTADPDVVVKKVKLELYKNEQTSILNEINDSNKLPKLRTYKRFKTSYCLEPCLNLNLPKK